MPVIAWFFLKIRIDSTRMFSFFYSHTKCIYSFRVALVVMILFVNLSACSMFGSSKSVMTDQLPKSQSPNWSGLVLLASTDANLNTAIAVDIVFAGSVELQSTLQDFNATKWFTARDSLMRSFPTSLNVVSLELVPGQTVMLGKNDYSKLMSFNVFVFANYATAGEHKSGLPLDQSAYVIKLDSKGFKVLPLLASPKS